MIMDGEIESLFKAWGLAVAPLGIDLLKRLLCPESSRFSIEEFLEHPFIAAVVDPEAPSAA
jgi:hypothetical protein